MIMLTFLRKKTTLVLPRSRGSWSVPCPRGKHDDQADSTSQALDWIKNKFQRPGWIVSELRLKD